MLQLIGGFLIGYAMHDALKPTVVGETLTFIELPGDTFVNRKPNLQSKGVQNA